MKLERRSAERYAIQLDEIHVTAEPRPRQLKAKDISRGGIALEYTPLKNELLNLESVDITHRDYRDIFLSNINCKTIYDIETLMEGQTFTGGKRRVCGVKFIELSKEQEQKLDVLMKRCFESPA